MSKYTDEELEAIIHDGCEATRPFMFTMRDLATELLAARKEPGVWGGAPDWATHANVQWTNGGGHGQWREHSHTRALPKTLARRIAEESAKTWGSVTDVYLSDHIEAAINRALEESGK